MNSRQLVKNGQLPLAISLQMIPVSLICNPRLDLTDKLSYKLFILNGRVIWQL